MKILIFSAEQPNLFNFSGVYEVFKEALDNGADVEIAFISTEHSLSSSAGLMLSGFQHYSQATASRGDYLLICGRDPSLELDGDFHNWLHTLEAGGVRLASICTGAFILGWAGLLNGRKCTTHWKYTKALAEGFPKAQVVEDQIFVKDRDIITSAGSAAGIDLALSIIEEEFGAQFTCKVARELVVYLRRDGTHTQKSIYLNYRNHIHQGIHKVQDFLLSHMDKKSNLDELADLANMSTRNLTRVFKKSAGITINEFTTQAKITYAQKLLNNSDLTIEAISARCGYDDATQFRRIWKSRFKKLPSQYRAVS